MKNSTEILLSICICTLPERKYMLHELIEKLEKQINNTYLPAYKNEIIYDAMERGLMTIGAKRNKLKNYAKGKYICYIDDDDTISGNYIDLITEGAIFNVDIITFGQDQYINGRYLSTTYINRFLHKQNKESQRFLGTINNETNLSHISYHSGSCYHLTPVKREISLQIKFRDVNNLEDHFYSEGIKRYLQSEYHIPHILYIVNHNG